MIRISLDQEDFAALVRGEVVRRPDVVIGLRDIGWTVMLAEIERAVTDAGRSPADTRQIPLEPQG